MSGVVVALHRRVWNPGARHRALLLHGLGSDGSTLWRPADHLARLDYEVVAPDLRGQGLSPPAGSYALEDLAADVRALGTGWDLVLGHSLGGAVAAVLLAEEGFAAHAVLLDPVLVVAEEEKPDFEQALCAEVGGALTIEAVRARAPAWDDEDVHRLVMAGRLVTPHVVRRIIADSSPWDLTPLAARWTSPVTILAADPAAGALFTQAHAAAVTGACDTVRVLTVAQAGHNVHRDAPDTVLAAIDHAIAQV